MQKFFSSKTIKFSKDNFDALKRNVSVKRRHSMSRPVCSKCNSKMVEQDVEEISPNKLIIRRKLRICKNCEEFCNLCSKIKPIDSIYRSKFGIKNLEEDYFSVCLDCVLKFRNCDGNVDCNSKEYLQTWINNYDSLSLEDGKFILKYLVLEDFLKRLCNVTDYFPCPHCREFTNGDLCKSCNFDISKFPKSLMTKS